MKKVIGYQWYIKYACGAYVPEECIYPSVEGAEQAIATYIKDTAIPKSAIGIDKVENDDGFIEDIEQIVVPTGVYYEDAEWEEE